MKALITGADGQLGLAFQKELTSRGIPFFAAGASQCDITRPDDVGAVLDAHKPAVLINCAAYNLVDDAELQPDAAFAVNAQAVKVVALACQVRGIKLIHYGTDYIFDGTKNDLYIEDDQAHPLNVYGASKLEGEIFARTLLNDHLILRTSWVYGAGRQNFLYKVSQWAQKNKVLRISEDEISVPTSTEDIVKVTLQALDKGLAGLYHLTSSGYASRYELTKYFNKMAGFDVDVIPVPVATFQLKAARPLFSAMSNKSISTQLNIAIPAWQEGVEKYVRSYL